MPYYSKNTYHNASPSLKMEDKCMNIPRNLVTFQIITDDDYCLISINTNKKINMKKKMMSSL